MKKNKNKTILNIFSLFALLKNLNIYFLVGTITQLLAIMSGVSQHYVIKYFIDDVILAKSWQIPFYVFFLIYLSLACFRGSMAFFCGKSFARLSEKISLNLRNNMFDHIQRLTFTYHDCSNTGDLVQRCSSDIDSIRNFFNTHLRAIIRIFFMFIVNFTAIFLLNKTLALISVLSMPFVLTLSIYFFKKIFASFSKYQEQDAVISANIRETLTSIRVIKAFARQEYEINNFEKQNKEKYRRGRKLIMADASYWPISHIICTIQLITGLVIAGILTLEGIITPGVLIAYSFLVSTLIWPIQHLGKNIVKLSNGYVSYNRIREILKQKPEALKTGINHNTRLNGKVEFYKVDFSYENGQVALNNINFTCHPGEKIGIIGEAGSGKTSLINLILRFYDNTGGRILLDDKPLVNYSPHFIRENIGLVAQEPFIFSTTIRENIAYGVNREVTQQEIENAAKMAELHENIIEFSEQYETIVGERGVTLSGGQKQRLAIARVFLKNPQILILDDSTSALDTETEKNIIRCLRQHSNNRTIFIIAHKVQSLIDADQILVLNKGKIVEKGNHDRLMQFDSFYHKIFDAQVNTELN